MGLLSALRDVVWSHWSMQTPAVARKLGLRLNSEETPKAAADLISRVSWMYAATWMRAEYVSQVRYEIHDQRDRLIEDAQQPDWMRNKLRNQRKVTEASLCLHGASYLYHNRLGKRLAGVSWMNPRSITILWAPEQFARCDGYLRDTEEGRKPLKPEDVTPTYLPSLTAERGPGDPPSTAALLPARLTYSMYAHSMKALLTGGLRQMLLKIPRGINKNAKEELEAELRTRMSGESAAFGVLGTYEDIVPQFLDALPKELLQPTLATEAKEAILTAFRVPYSMAISYAANRAVSHQDVRTFISGVIVPEVDLIDDSWNNGWLKELGWHIVSYPRENEAFQAIETEKLSALVQAHAAGIITTALLYQLMDWPEDEMPEEKEAQPVPANLLPFTQPRQNYEDQAQQLLSKAAKEEGRLWAAKTRKLYAKEFDPNQPRDEEGKWSETGGGGGIFGGGGGHGSGGGGGNKEKATSWAKNRGMTDSEAAEFGEWFEGSKFVDETGDPAVMYHGTRSESDFDSFTPGDTLDSTGLVYITDSEGYAAEYGHTIEVATNARRPFDVTQSEEARKLWDDYVAENGGYTGNNSDREGYADDGHPFWENNDAVAALAFAHGYDSIVTSEGDGRRGVGCKSRMVRIIRRRGGGRSRHHLSPDVRESVHPWVRKSKRHGELAAWECRAIWPTMRHGIKLVAKRYGPQAAFAWTRGRKEWLQETHARVRAELEELYAGMDRDFMAAVERGEDAATIVNGLTVRYQTWYAANFARMLSEQALLLSGHQGIVIDAPKWIEYASKWANENAYSRGTFFRETTQPYVQDAVSKFMANPNVSHDQLARELAEIREGAFGTVRAEITATNEVSLAHEAAQREYQAGLAADGIKKVREWQTLTHACAEICAPMVGKREENGGWTLPTGEKVLIAHGHVRCDCYSDLVDE